MLTHANALSIKRYTDRQGDTLLLRRPTERAITTPNVLGAACLINLISVRRISSAPTFRGRLPSEVSRPRPPKTSNGAISCRAQSEAYSPDKARRFRTGERVMGKDLVSHTGAAHGWRTRSSADEVIFHAGRSGLTLDGHQRVGFLVELIK